MATDAQRRANIKYQGTRKRIVLWCSPEEKQIIDAKAAAAGESTNAWLKNLALGAKK